MKKLQLFIILLVAGSFILTSCKSKQTFHNINLSPSQQIILLDSTEAAQAIVQDDIDQFFQHIGVLDMSIQMKKNFPENTSRDVVLAEYQQFLKEDVLSFTSSEIEFLEGVFKKVLRNCNKVSANLLGAKTRLIKSHAKHYGNSVYYTRENIIVIPKYVLAEQNEEAVYGTMLHELFHIYSRYNPEHRAALYSLIGFKDIGPVSNLQIDPALKQRILLNPDGVDFSYAIQMDIGEPEPILAVPIIIANNDKYDNSKPQFFEYLDFGLYKISPPYSKMIKVHSGSDGNTLLRPHQLADFFRQIKDNTQYIIHPDEILADNFMFLINSKEDSSSLSRFSDSGKKLIESVEQILKGDSASNR